METRLTLRPGQPGTRKLVEKYGERLVCVGYVYDAAAGRRLKTVELVVESVPWYAKAESAGARMTTSYTCASLTTRPS